MAQIKLKKGEDLYRSSLQTQRRQQHRSVCSFLISIRMNNCALLIDGFTDHYQLIEKSNVLLIDDCTVECVKSYIDLS